MASFQGQMRPREMVMRNLEQEVVLKRTLQLKLDSLSVCWGPASHSPV